jgi:hypothetical protein
MVATTTTTTTTAAAMGTTTTTTMMDDDNDGDVWHRALATVPGGKPYRDVHAQEDAPHAARRTCYCSRQNLPVPPAPAQ